MQCQRCGRPLASLGAICLTCDQELSHPSHLDADTPVGGGRYRCPACHQHFDHWKVAPYPARARWYVPQDLQAACPVCAAPLQWATDPPPTPLSHVLWGIAVGSFWILAWNVPAQVRQPVRDALGVWATGLIPLLLLGMAALTVGLRGPSPGVGPGHFEPAAPRTTRWRELALRSAPIAALGAVWWATPPAAWLSVWLAGVSAGAVCTAAVLGWRIHTRRHRLHLDYATHDRRTTT